MLGCFSPFFLFSFLYLSKILDLLPLASPSGGQGVATGPFGGHWNVVRSWHRQEGHRHPPGSWGAVGQVGAVFWLGAFLFGFVVLVLIFPHLTRPRNDLESVKSHCCCCQHECASPKACCCSAAGCRGVWTWSSYGSTAAKSPPTCGQVRDLL